MTAIMPLPITHIELDPIVRLVNPSAEQRPAVTTRGVDVLVHAGAGSGKTRTLIARYLSLVAEGHPPRAIVAITFTEKASLEMRSRLRTALRDYLRDPALDAHTRTRWEGIERDLDSARIGTIHALCTEILRRHPAEARLDPNFSVLDETQALLLRMNALDDAMAAAVVDARYAPLFAALKVDAVRGLLESMLKNRLALAEIDADAAQCAARALIQAWKDDLRAFVAGELVSECLDALRASHDYAQSHPRSAQDKAFPVVCSALHNWNQVTTCLDRDDWGALLLALREARNALNLQVGAVANWPEYNPKAHIKLLKEALVARLGDKSHDKTPDLDADERLLALRPLALRTYAVACRLYEAAKQARGALDFDDLEVGALNLLRSHPAVRAAWQEQIVALLVDEFQDTNQRQAGLVRLLRRGPGCVFMVGDAQQSIYGFRGADLRVFHAERMRLADEGGTFSELALSYRTHAALLGSIEALLRPLFDGSDAAAFRARFSPLLAMRAEADTPHTAPFIEFHLASGNKADALACAANGLAARLHVLHNQGVEWGQMAILCRKSGAFACYEDALERASIPNVTVAGRGFYDRPEVRDILNALQAVADPFDNAALVGLLRSPAVGMTDFAIMQLCDDARAQKHGALESGALWSHLQRVDAPDAREAVMLIRALNQRAGRVSVAVLLEEFLNRSTYSTALLQAGQPRAARNLTKLMDEARAAPSPSVRDFLERIAAIRAVTAHEGEARADESGAVQIMTVHAAKGLEFSIVVIGDAGVIESNKMSPLQVDEEAGILFSTREEEGADGILVSRATAHAKLRAEAESERILYVAATRARDVLIFSGHAGQRSDGKGCSTTGWLKKISTSPNVQPMLDSAIQGTGERHTSACGSFVCTVHTPESAETEMARVNADAPARGAGASAETADEAQPVWDPRMIAPVASKPVPTEYAMRAWRVASDPAAREAPAWVIGEIVHEAIAAWRFPDDGRLPEFRAWVMARAEARGVHSDALRTGAVIKVVTLLENLRRHALYAEIAGAARRFHEVPYQCTTADNLPDNGRIDLLYARPQGVWRVVDFKTSCISATRSAAWSIAHNQFDVTMRRYGHAVEALVGERPELLLCFIDTPEGVQLHPVPFDAPEA